MKRSFIGKWVAAFAALLLAAGCASLLGPRQVEVPLYRLQEAVDRHFPIDSRYLELVDVSFSRPKLSLQPGANRIVASFDAEVAPFFFDRTWSGTVAISGGLRFDTSRNAILLDHPRVENFNVTGLDSKYARQLGKVGSLFAEELLKDMPLHTFAPDQLRYGGVNFYPSQIATTADSLVVTFVPIR